MERAKLKPEQTLSPREFEVVALISRGLSSADLGQDLGIRRNSVHHHVWKAKRKTGTETTVALALWFVRVYPTELDEAEGYARACVLAQRKRTERRRQTTTSKLGK